MPIDRRTLIGCAVGRGVAAPLVARARAGGAWPPPEQVRLWPGAPAGAAAGAGRSTAHPRSDDPTHLRDIAVPMLGVYRPQRPDGRAMLILPGGGYGFVSIRNEGYRIAERFVREGITCFVLAYRLPREGWRDAADVPLQDAQRAMRLIRADAARSGIDPRRLGVIGFSAGGHLAGSLVVGHDDRVYPPVDAADAHSARPAFAGLIYPVVTLGRDVGTESFRHLLPDADAATRARYEIEARVTADAPPLFLMQALDDRIVDPSNTLAMLGAARAAHVPVEAHLFERGGHGFGLDVDPSWPIAQWPNLFAAWLGTHIAGTAGR